MTLALRRWGWLPAALSLALTAGGCRAPEAHERSLLSVAVSPDGRLLATGSYDRTAVVWDARSGRARRTLRGHTDLVGSVAFLPGGRTLMTGSSDTTVRLWDAESGELLRTLLVPGKGVVAWHALSPDGRTVAVGGNDPAVRLWDLETGKLLRTLVGTTNYVYGVEFSPDGRTLAVGSLDGVRLWDVGTGALLRELEPGGTVQSVAFSPDGATLATGVGESQVVLWEVRSGRLLRSLPAHARTPELRVVDLLAFSPDGTLLASGSVPEVVVTDLRTGEPLHRWRERYNCTALAFSPDGGTLACAGGEMGAHGELHLFDVRGGNHLRTLK